MSNALQPNRGAKMKKEELRLTMIVSTFRDKLIELDEQEFIDWVEKTQFPMEEKWKKLNGLTEHINLRVKKRQLSFLKMVGIVKVG